MGKEDTPESGKEIVTLMLEPGQYPILLTDYYTKKTYTGVSVIDDDEIIRELNTKFGDMYSSCYEANSHGVAYWFNAKLFHMIHSELKSIGYQLVDRLNEINDGTYELDDDFSKWL